MVPGKPVAHLEHEGVFVPLTNFPFVIGRMRECELVISDQRVSRKHAEITRRGNEYRLRDLGSTQGTRVNGRKLTGTVSLQPGDIVDVCQHLIIFRPDAPASPGWHATSEAREAVGSTVMTSMSLQSETVDLSGAAMRLNALVDIVGHLQDSLVLDELLVQILETILRIFPLAECGLVLLPDASGEYVPAAARGRDGTGTVPYSRTIVGQALERKEAILSLDATADPAFDSAQSINHHGMRSTLCAPLLNREQQPVGILQIHSDARGGAFSEQDLSMLVTIATATALAVENARLHETSLERERILRDAELARDVQRGFLPRRSPQLPGYSFSYHYEAARSVGGDYCGFLELRDGRLAIALGDVSGKGVPAAMMMARLSAEVRAAVAIAADPGAALARINQSLIEAEIEDRFVTLFLSVLDPGAHTLQLASAGHLPAILRGADGVVEEIGRATAGMPLNIVEDCDYESATLPLEPGCAIVVYSDGITEARNPAGEQFGFARLHRTIGTTRGDAQVLGSAIIEEAMSRFSGGEGQHDDATLICFAREA